MINNVKEIKCPGVIPVTQSRTRERTHDGKISTLIGAHLDSEYQLPTTLKGGHRTSEPLTEAHDRKNGLTT